jgi:metal-sulfur cluster biosynthetic enzyme
LVAQEQGTREARGEQQEDGGPESDQPPDADDQVDLGDGDADDQGQKYEKHLRQVYEALEEVIDPELGLDFVSLGLVYEVEVEGDEVFVTFTLTTPACPIGPQVSEQMKEFVGELDGVEKVHPKMIFEPRWSPEMMSEDAKFALGY